MAGSRRFVARWVVLAGFVGALPGYGGLLGTEVTAAFSTVTDSYSYTLGPQSFLVGSQNLNCPVVGPGLCDQNLLTPYSIDFSDNQITYNATDAGAAYWYPAIFNGWQFTNLNMGSPITGVGLSYSGFSTAPVVTFTANSVSVNVQGAQIRSNLSFTLTLYVTLVNVNPAGPIAFTLPQGGPVPPSQNLMLTVGPVSGSYSAQVAPGSGGNWLRINSGLSAGGEIQPLQASSLALSVDPTVGNALPAGQYTSQIKFTFPGTASPATTVNVNLTVVASIAPVISVSPSSLTFANGIWAGPATQAVVVSTAGGPVNFTATASSTGNWLTVDTSSGATPAIIHVGINPQNLPTIFPAGGLAGTVTIGSTGAPSIVIPVTLSAPPAPQPSTIQNSASLKFGAIAPGEFITILGSNLGPATPASFTVNSQGGIGSSLAGVQVMFDSFLGTPTYVSATQINVAVPYEVAGQSTTNLSVIYGGRQSAEFPLAIVPVAPGIFTFNATGQGPAIAINVSGPTAGMTNGPNSGVPISGTTIPSAPAAQGAFIAVYGTGGGVTSPAAKTGSVNSSTTLLPLLNWTTMSGTVMATIGGLPCYVAFAGAAPGLTSGVYQFNIQVPVGVTGDALALVIRVNGVATAGGATVAVQ